MHLNQIRKQCKAFILGSLAKEKIKSEKLVIENAYSFNSLVVSMTVQRIKSCTKVKICKNVEVFCVYVLGSFAWA